MHLGSADIVCRSGHGNAYAAQINDFLQRQDVRMKLAWEADQRRREQDTSLKRQRVSEDIAATNFQGGFDGKRRRLEDGSRATPPLQQQYTGNMAIFAGASGTNPPPGIADFDVTSLPINIVIECIVANLQVIGEEALEAAIKVGRGSYLASPTKLKILYHRHLVSVLLVQIVLRAQRPSRLRSRKSQYPKSRKSRQRKTPYVSSWTMMISTGERVTRKPATSRTKPNKMQRKLKPCAKEQKKLKLLQQRAMPRLPMPILQLH